jgi:hypothetical protein
MTIKTCFILIAPDVVLSTLAGTLQGLIKKKVKILAQRKKLDIGGSVS